MSTTLAAIVGANDSTAIQSMRTMLILWDSVYREVQREATMVYGKGPVAAIKKVVSYGTGAVTVFSLSSATCDWLNATAPLVGRKPIGSIQPDGYTFTPNADGSGVLTFVAPPVDPASNVSGGSTPLSAARSRYTPSRFHTPAL